MRSPEKRKTGISSEADKAVEDHAFLWDDAWGNGDPNPGYAAQMDALMPAWQRKRIAERRQELAVHERPARSA